MTTRLARWTAWLSLASACCLGGADGALGQAVDLLGLGINANFETPDQDLADSNTTEITSTNNMGAGWNYTLLGGAVANYGVADPIGDATTPIANMHYCCYSASPTGGVLPTPFEGRQIGFFNLPDTDSIAQIASIPVGSLLAGQTYTLDVAVGGRATDAWADVNYAIGLATSTGIDLGTMTALTVNPANANQTNITNLTYTLNVNSQAAAFVGQDVSIVIRANNGFSGGTSPPDFTQANFDNVRLSGTLGAVSNNAPLLTINRATGAVSLSKTGSTDYNIIGYELSSPTFGTFNPGAWTNIAAAYDDSGNGSVDSDNDWTVLSAPSDNTNLSEAELEGGNGGSLATASPISLGTPWLKTPYQDVTAKLLLFGGAELVVPVQFTGIAIPSGDLDGSATITGADWTLFKTGQAASFVGLSPAEAYLKGDLNNDGGHTLADFVLFRAAYDAANGVGSFTALLASVPEPSAAGLLLTSLVFMRAGRRRRFARGPALAGLAAILLIGSAARQADAALVAGYDFEGSADDVSGNALHGILRNAAAIVTDPTRTGTVLQLNDADLDLGSAYMDINDPTGLLNFSATGSHQGSSTVMAWVFSNDFTNHDCLFNQGEWRTGISLSIKGDTVPTDQLWAGRTGPNQAARSDIGVPTGAWQHIAVTRAYDGTNTALTFYINGVATGFAEGGVLTGRVTAPTNNNGMGGSRIGAEWRNTTAADLRWLVNGRVDDVGIFDTALTQSEVAQFMNSFPGAINLDVRINPTTGKLVIYNDNPMPLSIGSYEITSAAGSLDATGWSKISSQSIGGFPVGNGSGNGWEAAAGSTDNELTEWFLTGSSTIAPGAQVNLGNAFDEVMNVQDLVFKYTTADGQLVSGKVAYTGIPFRPGDFNKDGAVNGADLTIWRGNFGSLTANDMTGDADGDGDADGNDFLTWQRNVGPAAATPTLNAVPEPATGALLALAGIVIASTRRKRRSVAESSARAIGPRVDLALAAALVGSMFALTAQAAVTLDRTYRFGDDPAEFAVNSVGGTVGAGNGNVTFDSTGVSMTGTFQDLEQSGGPTYVDVGPGGLARPGALASERGIAFDGVDDYLVGLKLGYPGTTASSTFGGGTQNYKGLSNRGYQLWVRPSAAGTGLVQNVALDTNQHGVRINAAGNWVLRYNGADVASTKPVAFDAWTHIMVIRPYGTIAPTGGGILYVNGEAVAASSGNYNVNQDFRLVVGSDTGDGVADFYGTTEFFNGALDELTMFVLGKTVDGVDRGTFNFGTDNRFATQPIALGGLTGKAGDVNQDNALTAADTTALVAGWGKTNQVNNVRVGDIDTILDGDLNFDGATNLTDAGLLNAALAAASLPLLDVSLLTVPEPASLMLAAPAVWLALRAVRRRRAICD
jgi:hypothetical protein